MLVRCARCPAGLATCPRCTRRLCIEHTPLPGALCLDCEVAYQASRDGIATHGWFLAGFVLPWILFVATLDAVLAARSAGGIRGFSTGIPVLDAVIMAGIASVLCGKAAVALRERLHRERFVRA